MWQLFAEPESSEDLERCQSFWNDVVRDARSELQTQAHATRNTPLVPVAYSYLRVKFGRDVREAYANLKRAFGIINEKDFTLLLICDEARILCDISAIDGNIIPADLDFNLEREIRSPTETNYPPFSNFSGVQTSIALFAISAIAGRVAHPSSEPGRGSIEKASDNPRSIGGKPSQ
jgi:hypothetical protein